MCGFISGARVLHDKLYSSYHVYDAEDQIPFLKLHNYFILVKNGSAIKGRTRLNALSQPTYPDGDKSSNKICIK